MKPKKLTLREIHKLYLLLRDALPDKEEAYLLDEVEMIIEKMKSGIKLIRAIEIMYPDKNFNHDNPLELLLLFARGIKGNDFFEYVAFVNGIKNVKPS